VAQVALMVGTRPQFANYLYTNTRFIMEHIVLWLPIIHQTLRTTILM